MKEYCSGGQTKHWSKMNQKMIQMIFCSGMISSINVFQLKQQTNPRYLEHLQYDNIVSLLYIFMFSEGTAKTLVFGIVVKFPGNVLRFSFSLTHWGRTSSFGNPQSWGGQLGDNYLCVCVLKKGSKKADSPTIVKIYVLASQKWDEHFSGGCLFCC